MTKTNLANCETPLGYKHCEDHSGLLAWLKSIAALLTVTSGLLGYSVLSQAPSIRSEVAKEIARLDKEDQRLAFKILNVEKDVYDINQKVTLLQGKIK